MRLMAPVGVGWGKKRWGGVGGVGGMGEVRGVERVESDEGVWV